MKTINALFAVLLIAILPLSSCKKDNPDDGPCLQTCELSTMVFDRDLTDGSAILIQDDTIELENCDSLYTTELVVTYGDIEEDSTQLLTRKSYTCQ